MNRRHTLRALAVLGAAPLAARGQPSTKVFRIGVVSAATAPSQARTADAFRQELRRLGYDERTIAVEYRYSDGDLEHVRASIIEMARLKLDVIVSAGTSVTRIARDVTTTIPIVMLADTDPVGMRFVKSLSRPGGNVTGLTNMSKELVGKQMELLKELIPRVARVAILWNPGEPGIQQSLRYTRDSAKALGMQVQLLEQWGADDLPPAFDKLRHDRTQGLIVLSDFSLSSNRRLLIKLADQSRIPVIYWASHFVDDGGLLSYSAIREDLARRAAGFVDKILKGARPADLPVEQPTRFELAIYMKSAKSLGLTIPQSMLLRADRVIE